MALLLMFVLVLFVTSISMSICMPNTLRIYHSFAEIHQEYTGSVRFHSNVWMNIKQESIQLRPLAIERRIVRLDTNMTGRNVFVRRYAKHKSPIPCELINSDQTRSLVRDIQTSRYFYISNQLIEYPTELQTSSIYEVSFHGLHSNHSYMMNYILTNLRWQVRYTLQTYSNHSTEFQIFVDIINSSPWTSQFDRIHFMLGDINLVFYPRRSAPFILLPTSKIDYSGTDLFTSINQTINITPRSIISLPIDSPHIHVQIIYVYTLVLSSPSFLADISNKQTFHRLYQLSNSSLFLPTGPISLYDSSSNVFTGEWYLPSLIPNEKYEFQLGKDADVMLNYNHSIIINPKTNSSLIITNVLIQNYKDKHIQLRFKSICQYSMICFYYNDKARSLGSYLRYELSLKAHSEVFLSFTTVRMS